MSKPVHWKGVPINRRGLLGAVAATVAVSAAPVAPEPVQAASPVAPIMMGPVWDAQRALIEGMGGVANF